MEKRGTMKPARVRKEGEKIGRRGAVCCSVEKKSMSRWGMHGRQRWTHGHFGKRERGASMAAWRDRGKRGYREERGAQRVVEREKMSMVRWGMCWTRWAR